MTMQKNFRSRKIVLTAGVEYPLAGTPGNMYAVITAADPFEITFDGSNRIQEQTAGCGAELPFEYSDIMLLSPTTQTVTVIFGFGKYTDARANVNANFAVTVEGANQATPLAEISVPAGGSVQVVAADATRKELRLGVKSSEANGVYWGGPTVGAATPGGYIEEGGIDYITAESAIWVYNPGAGAVTVNAVSLERV